MVDREMMNRDERSMYFDPKQEHAQLTAREHEVAAINSQLHRLRPDRPLACEMEHRAWSTPVRMIGAILVALTLASPARADLATCMEATCRIQAAGHTGTGCIFATDDKFAYLLTNSHVAGQPGTNLDCEFIRSGHPQRVAGRTSMSVMQNGDVTRGYSPDCSVVEIPIDQFAGRCPKAIPLDTGNRLQADEHVISVGCPNGSTPTAFNGHVVAAHDWNVEFWPPPAGGRSGSAVFDAQGTCIKALITWNGGAVGVAQQSHAVAAAFKQAYPDNVIPVCGGSGGGAPVGRGPGSVPTQGGSCPNGNCGPHSMGSPRIFPTPPGEFDGNGTGPPAQRVPIDELGPVAPLNPVAPAPMPSQPVVSGVQPADLAALEQRIMAAIAAIKPVPGPSGPPGPAGPQGPAGPAGSDGTPGANGTAVEIDYDKLAKALAKEVPPGLSEERVVVLIKEHCQANKPVPEPERPATRYGYKIVPLPESK